MDLVAPFGGKKRVRGMDNRVINPVGIDWRIIHVSIVLHTLNRTISGKIRHIPRNACMLLVRPYLLDHGGYLIDKFR